MEKISYEKLSEIEKNLLAEAEKAMEKAYSPYSGFCVGAALLTKNDEIIAGANVENAAYSLCICAERSALAKANIDGHREFKAVAVIAKGKDFDTTGVTAPCGACRQMLYEVAQISGSDIKVISANTSKSEIAVTSVFELLPYAFGPKDLGVEVERYRN